MSKLHVIVGVGGNFSFFTELVIKRPKQCIPVIDCEVSLVS